MEESIFEVEIKVLKESKSAMTNVPMKLSVPKVFGFKDGQKVEIKIVGFELVEVKLTN